MVGAIPSIRLLLTQHARLVGVLVVLAGLLAVFTAAYGAMAGPLLHALFGGETLNWPSSVALYLPVPPSVEVVQAWIPWLLVVVAGLKSVVQYQHTVLSVHLEKLPTCALHPAQPRTQLSPTSWRLWEYLRF